MLNDCNTLLIKPQGTLFINLAWYCTAKSLVMLLFKLLLTFFVELNQRHNSFFSPFFLFYYPAVYCTIMSSQKADV